MTVPIPAATGDEGPPGNLKLTGRRDEQAPADNEVEAVVVTGSLLRRTDTATPSPGTVQTTEQLKAQGITTIADAIRSLSADNSGSIPAAFGNGSVSYTHLTLPTKRIV